MANGFLTGMYKIASEVKKETVHNYLKKNYPADTLKWVKNAEWNEEEVSLAEIKMSRRPGGPREQDKVKNIAAAFNAGEKMEPVVLIKLSDGTYKIADGFHRTLGCAKSNRTKIKAWVGTVIQEEGPWDKEMHARKLNIGKAAFETFEQFEKEAALIGGIARLGGKMIKSTGKEIKDFGKGITGLGTKGAKKNLATVKADPAASRTDISGAKKNVTSERMNQGKAFGIAGVGAAGMGINGVAKKMQEEPVVDLNQQQFETY